MRRNSSPQTVSRSPIRKTRKTAGRILILAILLVFATAVPVAAHEGVHQDDDVPAGSNTPSPNACGIPLDMLYEFLINSDTPMIFPGDDQHDTFHQSEESGRYATSELEAYWYGWPYPLMEIKVVEIPVAEYSPFHGGPTGDGCHGPKLLKCRKCVDGFWHADNYVCIEWKWVTCGVHWGHCNDGN